MNTYPEHDKVRVVQDRSQAIGEFLEWLGSKGVSLATYHEHTDACYDESDWKNRYPQCGYGESQLQAEYKSIEARLAEYFDIDQDRLESEKRAMLDLIRSQNEN